MNFKECRNLPVSTDANDSTSIGAPQHVRNILSSQQFSHITVMDWQRFFDSFLGICDELVSRKLLVMRHSKYINLV